MILTFPPHVAPPCPHSARAAPASQAQARGWGPKPPAVDRPVAERWPGRPALGLPTCAPCAPGPPSASAPPEQPLPGPGPMETEGTGVTSYLLAPLQTCSEFPSRPPSPLYSFQCQVVNRALHHNIDCFKAHLGGHLNAAGTGNSSLFSFIHFLLP